MSRLRDRWTIAALFGALLLAAVDAQMLIPLLGRLEADYGTSVEGMGRLFSVYALTAGGFNLVVGPFTDRWGRLPFLRAGLAVFALLALVTHFSGGYLQLLWLRAGTGAASGLISTCTAGLVGDAFPYRRRGRVMGIVLSAYFVALIVGVPAGTWIADRWQWRSVFLASCLLASAVLASLWGPLADFRSGGRTGTGIQFAYRRFFSVRPLRSALLVSFAVAGGTMALMVYLSGYLIDRFGVAPIQISWLFVVAGIAAVTGSLISGWVVDRWTKRKVFLLANLAFVLTISGLTSFPWGAGLIGLFFAVSLSVSFRQTALQTLQTQLVGIDERGSYLALRNCFSQLGIAVVVLVSGWFYSWSGYGAVVFLVALLSVAAGVLFFLSVQEPRGSAE